MRTVDIVKHVFDPKSEPVICRADLLCTSFCQPPADHEPQNSHPETCHHWNGAPERGIRSWTANPVRQAVEEAESAPCSKGHYSIQLLIYLPCVIAHCC
ncbi:unnamed protein product [Bubo scandiacus]